VLGRADAGASSSCARWASTATTSRRSQKRTKAFLGLVVDRVLSETDKAVRHCRGAMAAAMTLKPLPVLKPWYRKLLKRMQEIQHKARPLAPPQRLPALCRLWQLCLFC
jgi:hypothetical protein